MTGTLGYLSFFGNNMLPKNTFILTVLLFLISLISLIKADPVSAGGYIVSSSANLQRPYKKSVDFDIRILKLQLYLKKRNSPMELQSAKIVMTADRYGLDWRLVPAIAGVESSFGKRMPKNSYNAYGWANGEYKFNSWEESIDIVSKTLREKYIDKGADNLYKIARIYAPPSKTWARNVGFFVKQMDPKPFEISPQH
jgi:hypothetical protein